MKVRKEVLGDAYVDAALAAADEFTQPLQEYVTAHGWGASWARGGLARTGSSTASMRLRLRLWPSLHVLLEWLEGRATRPDSPSPHAHSAARTASVAPSASDSCRVIPAATTSRSSASVSRTTRLPPIAKRSPGS